MRSRVAEPKRKADAKKKKGKRKPKPIPALKLRPSTDPLPELGQVEETIRDLIDRAEEPRREGPGRRKVLPALCLWAGLLVCVLRGFQSQTEVWRLLAVRGMWSYPLFEVTSEAVRQRLLQKGGAAALQTLFEQITKLLAARLQPYAEDLVASPAAAGGIGPHPLDEGGAP